MIRPVLCALMRYRGGPGYVLPGVVRLEDVVNPEMVQQVTVLRRVVVPPGQHVQTLVQTLAVFSRQLGDKLP